MCLYPHEQLLLARELGLAAHTRVNPSGSGWAGHAVMATGLARVVEAARAVERGEAQLALAHASAGPCLQQNILTLLGADHG
jgi:acetyl-CoA acetyltransferase